MLKRIVSGGQTGVDQAALDAALAAGIPIGGWCPKGRRCETGEIPSNYPLKETPSPQYAQRTAWNVRDSDGTLILYRGTLSGGTALTKRIAVRLAKPVFLVDLDAPPSAGTVMAWLKRHHIRHLNVAGPRESQQPGIGDAARAWLTDLFSRLRA